MNERVHKGALKFFYNFLFCVSCGGSMMCLLVKNFIEWLTDYLLFSLSMPYFDLKITKNTREVSWTD